MSWSPRPRWPPPSPPDFFGEGERDRDLGAGERDRDFLGERLRLRELDMSTLSLCVAGRSKGDKERAEDGARAAFCPAFAIGN